MSNSNAFLAYATGVGANVESDASYAADSIRTAGVQTGRAKSSIANKAWRQSSVVAAMIGQFTADFGPGNVHDDGDVSALEAQFEAALRSYLITAAAAISPLSSTKSSTQTLTNAVTLVLSLTSASGTVGAISGTTFTAARAGMYSIGAALTTNITFTGAANASINTSLYKNGSVIPGVTTIVGLYASSGGSGSYSNGVNTVVSLNVGDTVSVAEMVQGSSMSSLSVATVTITITPLV